MAQILILSNSNNYNNNDVIIKIIITIKLESACTLIKNKSSHDDDSNLTMGITLKVIFE